VRVVCAFPDRPDNWVASGPKAGLFLVEAKQAIKKGEELLQDYGDSFWSSAA
jgi:hypothetical protein